MAHSFLSPPVEIQEGHPNFALGVRVVVPCIYGCRCSTVRAPPALAERVCRDGAFLDDAHPVLTACPFNQMRAAPAAAAAARQPADAAPPSSPAEAEGEWSQSLLRQLPPQFVDAELVEALRRVRKADAIETRLDEGRQSVSALIGDTLTERTFSRNRWTMPKDVFDTIPRRLTNSAIRRLSQANCLLLALVTSLAQPAAEALRASLGSHKVAVNDRLPGTEITGVADDEPNALRVIEAVAALCLEADGILLETAHFPNALRTAEDSGAVYLHGSQADLQAVRQQVLMARLFESRLDVDEATEPTLHFRPIAETLRSSTHSRLAVLYRTPTTWLPRKRLLRLHWRWFWHRYTIAADEVAKSQQTLQNQYSAWKDRRDQLEVLRTARSGSSAAKPASSPGAISAGKDGKPKAQDGHSPSAGKRKEGKSPRTKRPRFATDGPDAGGPAAPDNAQAAAGGSDATGAATGAATAAAPDQQPVCRSASSCAACGAVKDARHRNDCSWVAAARAAGRLR
jgi:hypothetical protein